MSLAAPVTPSRRNILKYLLTLAGVRNPSIHTALLDLLGNTSAECSAMCIPTAMSVPHLVRGCLTLLVNQV